MGRDNASSLVKVDADGGIIDHGSTESTINPAGFKIHSAIHLSERAADWIMHFHVPEVNAVANLKRGLIRGLSYIQWILVVFPIMILNMPLPGRMYGSHDQ